MARIAWLAALVCLLGAASSKAQQGQSAGGGVETITVTAEKRESPLQETPIAVTAFTGDQLDRLNVQGSEDIAGFTPGFVTSKASNTSSSMALFGRGIGNADNHPMVDTKVGLYVDGAYNSSGNGAMFDLIDIERVEVLRGPQGTLYGRNTTGGAINIISKKPGPDLGYKFAITVGDHDERNVKGTLNVPLLSETLYGRFSFARNMRGPFYDNDIRGDDFEDNDLKAFRSAIRLLPFEDVTVDWTFDWIRTDEHNPLFVLNSDCASGCITGAVPFTTSQLIGFTNPAGAAIFQNSARRDNGDIANDADTYNRFTQWNHALQIEYELSENATLKSISGWRRLRWAGANDLDGSALNMFHSGQDSFSRNFFQELQLIGALADGKFDYVLGGNWYQQKAHEENYSDQFIDCPSCTAGFPTSQTTGTKFDNYALAGFGQGTLHLTDKLSATAGVRYTAERKEAIYDLCGNDPTRATNNISGRDLATCLAVSLTPATNLVNFKTNARFGGWSPMARLDYQWTEDLMTYLTWARGYQSGGYSPRPSKDALLATTSPFDSESLFSWELGTKSRWFSNQLELNAAGYYNQFKDQQITTFVPGAGTTTFVDNAGRSRIRGFEVEATAAPNAIDGLLMHVSHAWTAADFAEFLGADPLNPGQVVNYAGLRKFGHLPKRKWSGWVQYSFAPQNWGGLVLTGGFVRESPKNWLGIREQDAHTKSGTYTKYDARIDLQDAFGMRGLRLSAIGRNITDRTYKCCQGIDFFFWQGGGFGTPRQLSFEVGYEWGGI